MIFTNNHTFNQDNKKTSTLEDCFNLEVLGSALSGIVDEIIDNKDLFEDDEHLMPDIERVFFNDKHTTIKWDDQSTTTVGCIDGQEFSKMTGVAMCIAKRYFENMFEGELTFKEAMKATVPEIFFDEDKAKKAIKSFCKEERKLMKEYIKQHVSDKDKIEAITTKEIDNISRIETQLLGNINKVKQGFMYALSSFGVSEKRAMQYSICYLYASYDNMGLPLGAQKLVGLDFFD